MISNGKTNERVTFSDLASAGDLPVLYDTALLSLSSTGQSILFVCLPKQMQILHVMSFIIERMTVKIRPHAGALVQYLPLLWEDSADHNMLRCAILSTLTFLVQVRHYITPLTPNSKGVLYQFLS